MSNIGHNERNELNISQHIITVFDEVTLIRSSDVAVFATSASDPKRNRVDNINHGFIVFEGYQVKFSPKTQFPIWSKQRLKEYLAGFQQWLK